MKKWQKLLADAQAKAAEARGIMSKADAEKRELTEDERTTYQKAYDAALNLKAASDQAKKDDEQASALDELAGSEVPDDDTNDQILSSGIEVKEPEGGKSRAFGDRFTKSAPYAAFRKQYPSGVGQGSPINIGRVKVGSLSDWDTNRKASLITSPTAHLQPTRYPTLDMVERPNLTLLDLVSRGQTGGNFEYLQITGVERNAKIVPEATSATDDAALKPLSDLQTAIADAKVYTYADGYEITNQMLADAPAFASYMNQELAYSLDNVLEEKLLNGTGTNGEPKGILSTTGVQQTTYTAGALASDGIPTEAGVRAFIRAARIQMLNILRQPGGTVQAFVMSPEMDAAIDLLQDDNGRYYSGGPFGNGPGTLWGRPRVTSERLKWDTCLTGDFKQVALLDREGLSVLAFNQHRDFAQRNLTYVRAELRAAQVIWRPNRLGVVKPAA